MLHTRVCDVLGITYPIVQAGMAVHTSPELVAAVSEAGGLGLIGTAFRELDDVETQVARVRRLTTRPFGANIVLAEPHDEVVELLLAKRVPVISTSWGDPATVVEAAHARGLLALHQVETVAEARRVAGLGLDALIAQGGDGGGHIGRVGTLVLVPAVVDVADGTPVLAAGGIADGRGLAAALLLGAEGALIGTRFLATREAPIPEGWKQALLAAAPEDAWQTDVPDLMDGTSWTGATVRVLANDLVQAWHGRENELELHREEIRRAITEAELGADPAWQFLYAGQSAGLIHDIASAGDLVRAIAGDAVERLRHVAAAT